MSAADRVIAISAIDSTGLISCFGLQPSTIAPREHRMQRKNMYASVSEAMYVKLQRRA